MTRRLVILALAVLAVLAAAPLASADGPRISPADGGTFPARSWVLSLPSQRALAAADLDVRENGQPVQGLTVTAGREAGKNALGVVLAIDASQSMHGDAITGAIAAARTFAANRAPNEQIGLLAFSHDRRVLLPLTADAARIDAALADTPPLSKGTRIYDAAAVAIGMLKSAGIRAGSVVVLSDGADVGSETSPAAFANLAKRSHVRVFTVGLQSASFNASTLQNVASSANGFYSEATSRKDLERIYGQLGAQIAGDYLVSYRSLAKAGTTVQVEVAARGVAGTAVNTYAAPSLAGAKARKADPRSWWTTTAAVAVATLLIALLIGAALWIAVRGSRQTLTERVGAYTGDRSGLVRESLTDALEPPDSLAERLLKRARWWPRFVERVDIAAVGVDAAQLAAATLLATIVLAWAAIASGRALTGAILMFLPVMVHMWLRFRVERTRRAFADGLSELLEVVASAMRAGHSFESGLAVASEDASEPIRSEIRRIVNDERLGVPLQEAMEAVAKRMECPEFEQIGSVVVLQRHSGGNTAELLDRTTETLRHRADLRRLVRQLTAQGRMGGLIVSSLPIALALLLSAISPGYLKPMVEHSAGVVALIGAGMLVTIGWLIINKLVDVKV